MNESDISLPILLISASDNNCVSKFLADLLDEDDRPIEEEGRVWLIQNKYYRAKVHLRVWADGAPRPPVLDNLEAHVVYLGVDEDESRAERRVAAIGEGRVHVRLAVLEGRESDALAAWALRRRYEIVTLAPDDDADDEGADAWGAGRARAALHAHLWRGLERLDSARAAPPVSSSGSDADDDEAWGEWEAWGAVSAAREARGALGAEPDAERRRRAEALLQAFLATLK